ncbi:restriction endonuclease subunit S [Anoxybacillus gonensis]|uniref:restriction endonuclease subunit S n=1 Tax=Anoxybacillus gonensis TaxID=198467 RepID=UPI0002BE4E20|nr:restriction endonuclease subunit S [Anoxybacillus gonensis]EMI11402.1 restriction modification system DNA specificity domain containing protein [Anoxybacillus gonensis]
MSKWIEGKLKDLVEVNPTVKLRKGEIYPFVSMDVIQPFYKPVEAKEEREFKSGGAKFENGDTLFARITPCLENGKIAQVKNLKNGKGFGSTEFIVLRGKEGITDTDFVYYLVTNKSFRENAERLMVGTSGRQRVDKQQFENQIISIPDLETQKRISSILGSIDKKIELNIEMNKTLEEMAMTLYKHWFVDFGPFQDGEFVESELGMIPKGWYIKELNEFSTIQNGFAFKMEEYTESGVKILRTLNITDKSYLHNEKLVYIPYESKDKYEKFNLEKYDVLLVMVGASIGKMGIVFEHNLPALQNQNMWRFRPTLSYLHPAFIYFSLKEGLKILRNSSTGSAREFFRKDVFGKLKYIIPPENVGKEFKRIIDPIWEQINNNLIQNVTLTQLRDYLLPRLLSGEIDLSQAEKQVEEVL